MTRIGIDRPIRYCSLMLARLSIRDIVLIERLDIDFRAALPV